MKNFNDYELRCPGCATLNKTSELKKEWVLVNGETGGKELMVTYYRCISCKKIHIVQLDDKYTQELFEDLAEGIRYSAICKKEGKQPKRKKANRILKINKKIKNVRKQLNKEYDGSIVFISSNSKGLKEEVKIHVELQEE